MLAPNSRFGNPATVVATKIIRHIDLREFSIQFTVATNDAVHGKHDGLLDPIRKRDSRTETIEHQPITVHLKLACRNAKRPEIERKPDVVPHGVIDVNSRISRADTRCVHVHVEIPGRFDIGNVRIDGHKLPADEANQDQTHDIDQGSLQHEGNLVPADNVEALTQITDAMYFHAVEHSLWPVGKWHNGFFEAVFPGLVQPFLTVGHGTHFPGQSQLAEDDEILRQHPVLKGRQHGEYQGEIGTGFGNAHTPDHVREHILIG